MFIYDCQTFKTTVRIVTVAKDFCDTNNLFHS